MFPVVKYYITLELFILHNTVYDHPFVPRLPGVLLAVGETSYGIQGWFVQSHAVFAITLCIYLHLRFKVNSYPVKHTKIISNKRITQLSLSARKNNLCFRWPHCKPTRSYRSLTQLLASFTQFRCLPLTVFPVWPFKDEAQAALFRDPVRTAL
jgi:hypothetical protein